MLVIYISTGFPSNSTQHCNFSILFSLLTPHPYDSCTPKLRKAPCADGGRTSGVALKFCHILVNISFRPKPGFTSYLELAGLSIVHLLIKGRWYGWYSSISLVHTLSSYYLVFSFLGVFSRASAAFDKIYAFGNTSLDPNGNLAVQPTSACRAAPSERRAELPTVCACLLTIQDLSWGCERF